MAVATGPDLQQDVQLLAESLSRGNAIDAAGDVISILIPGGSGGRIVTRGTVNIGRNALLSLRRLKLVQEHHILQQKFFKIGTQTGKFLAEIGFKKESKLNKVWLPTMEKTMGDRAKHLGNHINQSKDDVAQLVTDVRKQYLDRRISKEEALKIIKEGVANIRRDLIKGKKRLQRKNKL